MAPRRLPYDEYEPGRNLFWEAPEDDEPIEPMPLPVRWPDDADPRRYVQELLHAPPGGSGAPADIPDLRSAAREKLRSAGLFGNALAPFPVAPTGDDPPSSDDEQRGPPSWKLPPRARSILGDDTALGAGRLPAEIGETDPAGDASAAATTAASVHHAMGVEPSTPPVALPLAIPSESKASPLDHPGARTGLVLTAADTLLRKGADLAVGVAGGNAALARQLIELAAGAIANALPPEFRTSANKSAEAAIAEAERRVGDNAAATRNRAAIGTLTNRRIEAEREHAQVLIEGEPAKLAEARREAIDAWRAERIARGDGHAEINAGARALETHLRATALRHRLAQIDDAGIDRTLDEDEDAKSDPRTAGRIVEEIRRIRRDDPARAGEASIAREIEKRKRDGRIDTPDEETSARYKLRLEAQAQRGIPEPERRILTNEERAKFAAEYHHIESQRGKAAADQWLHTEAQKAGPRADRFEAELAAPPVRHEPQSPDQTSNRLTRQPTEAAGVAVDVVRGSIPDPFQAESDTSDEARSKIQAEDRRQPEPPASSYPVGAEFGAEHPTSPPRELRKLIGRLYSVAALKSDGTPVVGDQEVAAYIDEARKQLRPEYQDTFELTVFAVRAGMVPWWRASERLRDYYAPESTGEAVLDGILDVIPIVGQVKGAIEIGEALDGLRIALDEDNQAGASKFAGEAALLIAGLVPILKAGKFAKHIPGLERLKDILGEFAGGKLPFHELLEKWNKNWKLQGHHSFPIFLGGARREGVAELRTGVHRELHRELNAFLRGISNAEGKHMRPVKGNPGWEIRNNFKPEERMHAMVGFYTGPGNRLKYRNARREFFRLFPELAQ